MALIGNKVLDWPDLIALVIVGTPSIIAAVSSLKNGHVLRNGIPGRENRDESHPHGKKPKKNGKKPDWYAPPDL